MCWEDVIKKDIELLGGGSGDCKQWKGDGIVFKGPMNANKKKFMKL